MLLELQEEHPLTLHVRHMLLERRRPASQAAQTLSEEQEEQLVMLQGTQDSPSVLTVRLPEHWLQIPAKVSLH